MGRKTLVIIKRVCSFAPQCELHVRNVGVNSALRELSSIKKSHVRMCILKTWCNGWVMSDRMHHQHRKGCIFGCEGQRDNLEHYIHSKSVWSPILIHLRLPQDGNDLQRLAMISPSKKNFLSVAVAFVVFHSERSCALPLHPSAIKASVQAIVLYCGWANWDWHAPQSYVNTSCVMDALLLCRIAQTSCS